MYGKSQAFCLITALFIASANAATIEYTAPLGLTGSQEVPANGSTATGTGDATYDTVTMILSVSLTWQGFIFAPSAAHIHCCPGPGANGPVAIDFVPAGFPSGLSGMFTHDFDLTDPASYGAGFLSAFPTVDAAREAVLLGLNNNLAYFNIHTFIFPGGEIRGDIVVIPEPASLALIGLGLTAVALRRRFSV